MTQQRYLSRKEPELVYTPGRTVQLL